jgi:hypothetical protein
MEPKTKAIILTVAVVIFLLIAVIYKIKSDKKRKSLSFSSAEPDKNINVSRNATQAKKPNLWGFPSWGLALLTMFLAFVVLMIVGDIIAAVFRISEDNAGLVFYILYNLIIAAGCFFIVRLDPKSIWYVPVLCNIIGIISAIVEPNFWISSLWIVICGGWVLSIIAAVIGMFTKRRKTVVKKPES